MKKKLYYTEIHHKISLTVITCKYSWCMGEDSEINYKTKRNGKSYEKTSGKSLI